MEAIRSLLDGMKNKTEGLVLSVVVWEGGTVEDEVLSLGEVLLSLADGSDLA